MDPEEVAASLEELTSRLKPSVVEFMRARGARNRALQQAGASAAAATSHTSEASGSVGSSTSLAAAPRAAAAAAAAATAASAKPASRRQGSTMAGPGEGGDREAGTGRSAAEPGIDDRPMARLRWGLRAQVVGLQALSDTLSEEEVRVSSRWSSANGCTPSKN